MIRYFKDTLPRPVAHFTDLHWKWLNKLRRPKSQSYLLLRRINMINLLWMKNNLLTTQSIFSPNGSTKPRKTQGKRCQKQLLFHPRNYLVGGCRPEFFFLRSSTIEVLLFILTGEPLERLMILLPTRMRQSYSFGRICKGRWELKVSQSMLTEKLLKDTLRRDLVDPRSVHGLPANRMLSRTEKN